MEGMLDKFRVEAGLRRGASNVSLLIADNFRTKNKTEPNRFVREGLGSRRTYFWRRMADSVKPAEIDVDAMKVRIPMSGIVGFKQRGGTVYPVRARSLTIPVHPEAYGRRAATLERALSVRLFILRTKLGDSFLAGRIQLRKGRWSVVRFYILKASVTIGPWPGTLPPRTEIRSEFMRGFKAGMSRGRK